MTYAQLLAQLNSLSKAQLECNVTVYDADQDEYGPLKELVFTTELCDVLDQNHPVLQ